MDAVLTSIHNLLFELFGLVWLLFNVPINTFSVMLGRSHCFIGVYQYFGELKVSC